jgi:hypothetical protein
MDATPEAQPDYHHRQQARPFVVGLALGALIMLARFLHDLGRQSGRALSYLPGVAGLAFGAYLLSSLTVEVNERDVRVAFAGGLFARSVPLASVEEVEVVRVPWYYGWGLRLTPTGWLYRVWGSDAVRLRLDSGRTLTIGTDQPYLLRSAVLAATVVEAARDNGGTP